MSLAGDHLCTVKNLSGINGIIRIHVFDIIAHSLDLGIEDGER
jgi:hypothetical protein